jgi:type IV secretory pathway TraG/TraD family ATPase VirD4
MPSQVYLLEAGRTPVELLGEAARWTAGAGVECALGVALGVWAARAMRRKGLHHRCAAVVLVVVWLAHGLLGARATATLAVACVCALGRARRWHREDVEAGEDLARAAGRRRGPLALAWELAGNRMRARARVRVQPGACASGAVVLGREERGRTALLPLGGAVGGTHTLVVGATGAGKTVTQSRIVVGAIEQGMSAVVLDPKGDASLRSCLVQAAARTGRQFIEWTPDGEAIYNPFAAGSESEIADKALAGERFTEPHYLRQAQRYLAHAVRTLRAHEPEQEVSLRLIVECLEPERLELLARELSAERARAVEAYLDSLSTRQQSDLAGVRDRLAILAESDVGAWLDPQTQGGRPFQLLASLRAGAVVYFSLQSDRRPLLSQMLAAAIVQDLQTVVASCQQEPLPTLVAIDEFSALAADQVVRLFGRARSAGVSVLLGTQEIADLRPPGRERVLEQVLGNLTAVIAHRQVVRESAELVAGLAGTTGAWRVSRDSGGRTTRTRTRRPRLEAEEVRRLQQGHAALIELGSTGGVRIVRVLPPPTTHH